MLYISDVGINRRYIDNVVAKTKKLFFSNGIILDEKFVTVSDNDEGYSWTWDDGKDFDNEDYRSEFNHLVFFVRNFSGPTEHSIRLQFLWGTRK